MDLKERKIFNYYNKTIETNNFTEIEIYSFLILIRQYVNDNKLKKILEFCDLIAHRERDRGIGKEAMEAMEKNGKIIINGKERIENYKGITEKEWEDEWKQLAQIININITQRTLKEITLCIFSLAQDSRYYVKNENGIKEEIGRMCLLADKENDAIILATRLNNKKNGYVNFATYKGYKINKKYTIGDAISKKISTTYRENGILKLRYRDKIIVEDII